MSKVVYLGNVPYHWNIENIKSVIKNSGPVVEVRLKSENGKHKGFCFVEYLTPQDAQRALQPLSEVKINGRRNFRVELSKDPTRNPPINPQPLILTRDALPPNVIIPQSLRGPDEKFVDPPKNDSQIPGHLLNAVGRLPEINKEYFKADDKVSKNLEPISPPQIIQLLATLKNLIMNSEVSSAVNLLKINPQLTTAIAQALLLMGFVDHDVITQAISITNAKKPQMQQGSPLQPFAQNSDINSLRKSYENGLPQNPLQQNFSGVPGVQSVPPTWSTLPQSAIEKLLNMDRQQADVIVQVLLLTEGQISALPEDQKEAIRQIKNTYL